MSTELKIYKKILLLLIISISVLGFAQKNQLKFQKKINKITHEKMILKDELKKEKGILDILEKQNQDINTDKTHSGPNVGNGAIETDNKELLKKIKQSQSKIEKLLAKIKEKDTEIQEVVQEAEHQQ